MPPNPCPSCWRLFLKASFLAFPQFLTHSSPGKEKWVTWLVNLKGTAQPLSHSAVFSEQAPLGKACGCSGMVTDEYFWDTGLGGSHDPKCNPHSPQPASPLVRDYLSPRSISLLILSLGGEEGSLLLSSLKTRLPICPLFHSHSHPDRH